MKYVLIIHEVADYSNWKKVFDNAATIRKAAGEISYQVFNYESQHNKIVHLSVWISHANAKHFFQSAELIKIRAEAGVEQPEFMYLEQLENGIL